MEGRGRERVGYRDRTNRLVWDDMLGLVTVVR
jgi:hypothetical protein